jgi:diguanylate cyclase (GGDEF)-like protein
MGNIKLQLSKHAWKAVRTTSTVTLAATVLAFLPVWIWLQLDPVITVRDIYISAIALPLLISPACSIGIQRAHLKVRRLADRNEYLANHDELTGLPNRRAFFARSGELLARPRSSTDVFVCAIADIDNFKRINDTLGHETGDLVLKSMSTALQDFAPEGVTVARLGGEEFALAGLFASETAARIWFEALVRETARRRPASLDVTISLGWCVGQSGENLSTQLSRADHALYEAKYAGKNRAVKARGDVVRIVSVA